MRRLDPFVVLQVARFSSVLGIQMVSVAVGWEVYARTGRPLDLGLVGLVQFIPALLLFPVTGLVADRVERTGVLRTCAAAQMLAAATLAALARLGAPLWAVYLTLVLLASARAFAAPASSAILPALVGPERFPRAVALASSIMQVATIAGPALGGAVYALSGRASVVYGIAAGLIALAVVCLSLLPPVVPEGRGASRSWDDVFAGLRFLRGNAVLFSAVMLDLFAVLLGGAVALLPAVASDVLGAGPEALGVLRGAPAVGAAAMALWMSRNPPRRHAGRVMLGAVALFGLATIMFGLSKYFLLSVAMLVLLGAADEVSVVIRQTLLQVGTPDHMRGRVSAVNMLFVGISNEIGELESGLVAAVIGVVPAIVAGGVGTLAVVVCFVTLAPALRDAHLGPKA